MAWRHLTYDDLKLVLAQDELDKLDTLSIEEVTDICNKQLDMVADAFRGAFQGKGYKLDIREHYVPGSYVMAVLNVARYQIWTRFPFSPSIALDEARTKEYEYWLDMLKNPQIGAEDPDYSDDPELSGYVEPSATGASIFVPNMRIKTWWYGGPWPLYSDRDKGCGCCCK